MKRYEVCWSKSYIASGTTNIMAESEEEAEELMDDMIGGLEGSMQYQPEGNSIEVFEIQGG
jgi:hypothetical protein